MKFHKKNRTPNRSLQKSALFTSKQNTAFRRAPVTLIGGSREKKNLLNYFFSIFFQKIIFYIVV